MPTFLVAILERTRFRTLSKEVVVVVVASNDEGRMEAFDAVQN